MANTLSLQQLLENVRRAMALNFPGPLWVEAEIAQVGLSRGHRYFDLVQKGEGQAPLAQATAVLWERENKRLLRHHGTQIDALWQPGLSVRLQVQVDFHERYGFKLLVCDADPAYTMGHLAQMRRQTVETLKREGLYDRNRTVRLPQVIQRLAVVSSHTAAGYQDFVSQLTENTFGYAFQIAFFQAAMQGDQVGPEAIAAFGEIERRRGAFDAAVLIRGGGARLDLMGFDDLELCRRAARLPLPLLTGIGHDSDESVLDLVAHRSLKTPTAVAEFIVQHNSAFETQMLGLYAHFQHLSRLQTRLHHQMLETTAQRSALSRQRILQKAQAQLSIAEQTLRTWPRLRLQEAHKRLAAQEELLSAVNPETLLRRGYSITYQNGAPLRSAVGVQPGDVLLTRLVDGDLNSEVK